jgi:hypothetical protein
MANIQGLDLLRPLLSQGASIDVKGDENYTQTAARWSEYQTPKPGAVVNIGCEADIEATVRGSNMAFPRPTKADTMQVKWATARKVPFCAQSGAHGSSTWFKLDSSGIVINMRKLNTVEVDMEKKEAVLGGGVVMLDVLKAGKQNKAHISMRLSRGVWGEVC